MIRLTKCIINDESVPNYEFNFSRQFETGETEARLEIIFNGHSGSGKTKILTSIYQYLRQLSRHCNQYNLCSALIDDQNNPVKMSCNVLINETVHQIHLKEINSYDLYFRASSGVLSEEQISKLSNVKIGFWEETRKPSLNYFENVRFCWGIKEKDKWFHIINEAWNKFHATSKPHIVLDINDLSVVHNLKNNKTFSFDKLSAGEKDFLNLISYMIINQDLDIFLIDRPELFIRQVEERFLLSVMKKILPNTQIFIATNSDIWCDKYHYGFLL